MVLPVLVPLPFVRLAALPERAACRVVMSFNGINVNHIRGGARTYPATSLVG